MKRKGIVYAGIFLGVLLLCVPLVYGETVTTVGQAPIIDSNDTQARLKAIEDARRAAVEQGVGTLIDSQTKVANFEVLQDRIYSRASGYVTNYSILSEAKTPDGFMYTVTIRADVQTASIKNDLRAIGILMAQVGNPRFMAVYLPETRSSAYRHSRVVRAAEQAINGIFARKGFIVLDRMFINNVYNEIEQAGRIDVDIDDLSALALKHRADLLLVYDVHAARKVGGRSKYFSGIIVEIALRAVAPATADLIAQKSGDLYVRTIKTAGSYYDNMQAAKAADTVGKAVAEALIGDTLAYFERSVHAGARFDLWFRNFSEEETYTIVDMIEQMSGFKDRHVRNQSPGNFQLDVNYQGKKFDFQKELFTGLKQHGISFQTQQAKGNRFLFFKEGTDNPFKEIHVR
ncbi:MAG: flagellar assembly protein T N-terminal domain-containing protein [Euryarchaeota archaeon]|nr:flagellar assembly protein T N-terminal domain-containing protein [Euryarchaeota archaeon]